MISVPPESAVINATTDFVFKCAATTDSRHLSQLKIVWEKDGEPIVIDKQTSKYFIDEDNSLHIRQAAGIDTGDYTCVASTDIDRVEETANLIVRGMLGRLRRSNIINKYIV